MKTLSESMQMYGGFLLWVQILVILLVLIIAIIKLIQYFGNAKLSSLPFHKSHHAILFLGIFNLVWGMTMQVFGLVQALNAIIKAADVSPALLMEGLKNSFINPLIGLCTLLAASVLWAILQSRYNNIAR